MVLLLANTASPLIDCCAGWLLPVVSETRLADELCLNAAYAHGILHVHIFTITLQRSSLALFTRKFLDVAMSGLFE